MKIRRAYRLLALFGLVLLLSDFGQRWIYVHLAPLPASTVSPVGPSTIALLVAGPGMDEVESATCLRDLEAAASSLFQTAGGPLSITCLYPGLPGYSGRQVLEAIEAADCEKLVLYLTGHGGGVNFGAGGGLNVRRDELARSLSRAHFQRALVVIDCCWSGGFAPAFEDAKFPGSVTLVTSTDAHHPCPFPVSFLSPASFGRVFFDNYNGNDEEAVRETNSSREKLRFLYSPDFGLRGEHRHYP